MKKLIPCLQKLYVLCTLLSFSQAFSVEKHEVSVLLDWKPNTNHTGFFVAKEKGLYDKENLSVSLVNPTHTAATTLVATKHADFAVTYANDLIKARSAGLPIVAVAAIAQPDSSCFVWRKTSGIHSVKDFEGKRYGGWGSPEESATLQFVMEQNGADFSKLRILTSGISDFLQATEKNVDFTWEYKAWGVLSAQLEGVDVETYCPSEHFKELSKPSPIIITSEYLVKNRPEFVRAFLKATSGGYQFAIKNPRAAAEILIKASPGIDEKLVRASQKMISPMYQAEAQYWGYIEPKSFKSYLDWMFKNKLIDQKPDLTKLVVGTLVH